MKSPFKNDPFSMIYQAFQRLYPEKDCEIYWGKPEHYEEASYGMTIFSYDGSLPQVFIYPEYPVEQQPEILAHELAHVAVGAEHDHDEIWEAAFDAIQKEFIRIGREVN